MTSANQGGWNDSKTRYRCDSQEIQEKDQQGGSSTGGRIHGVISKRDSAPNIERERERERGQSVSAVT